jgi:hypothetical protein
MAARRECTACETLSLSPYNVSRARPILPDILAVCVLTPEDKAG